MVAVRGERESVFGSPPLRDLASPRTKKVGWMFAGYIPLRRGILEHARQNLTHAEGWVYILILLEADPATGIWIGSGKALGAYNFPWRSACRLLESLEKKGYIKRFPKPGVHSNYPILVNKYRVTVGEHIGELLDTKQTTSWKSPVYVGEHIGEQVAVKKERRIELGKKTIAQPSASLLSSSQLFEIWNLERGELPQALKLTPERKLKSQARLKSHRAEEAKFLADFGLAVKSAAQTPFLRGESERGWKASFDWLIANDTNYLKILEGKYQGRKELSDDELSAYLARSREDHSESSVGRGPRTEGKLGKCRECGAETAPGFLKCYACTKKKAPVKP